MKNLFFIATLLLGLKSFSQYPIISDIEKKPGIYRDYNEFKNNNPSIKLDYQIISKEINFSEVSSLKI